MKRYIDVDEAVKAIRTSPKTPIYGEEGYNLLTALTFVLMEQPAADVVPREEVEQLKAIIDRLEQEKAELLVSEIAEFSIPMEIAFRVRTEHPIVKAIKSEAAREIFADLEKELNATLENNYKRKRELAQAVDGVDNFDWLVGGKIDTLRGILDFLEELKQKYGVTENGRCY